MKGPIQSREAEIERIVSVLYPGGSASRTAALRGKLSTLDEAQFAAASAAVQAGLARAKKSVVADLIEARDIPSIEATAKWGKVIVVGELEARLSEIFGIYDIYTPAFEAHVQAKATYHEHCGPKGSCDPYDTAADYEFLEEEGQHVPLQGHYLEYEQDGELIELVEQSPEMVAVLVRLAAERRGIDGTVLTQLKESGVVALGEGLL